MEKIFPAFDHSLIWKFIFSYNDDIRHRNEMDDLAR